MLLAAHNPRSVGFIYLSHPDSESLQAVSNAVISVLASRNADYFPQLGGDPAQVTILDEPVITPAPPPLTNRFAPLIRIGIALLAGLMLAFFIEYLDPTVHHQDELRKLGVNILATIPKYKS